MTAPTPPTGVLSTLHTVLFDRSTQAALCTVLALDVYTLYRAHEGALRAKLHGTRPAPSATDRFVAGNSQTLQSDWAWALPVVASCTLVALFFLIHAFGALLTLLAFGACFVALVFVQLQFTAPIARRLRPASDADDFAAYLALPAAIGIAGAWMYTGNWALNNVLGCSLVVLFGCVCRLDSFRVATVLFAGLFCYDVFFVFFSERVFGRNVMVEVATSTPSNPLAILVSWLHLPLKPVRDLALPAKLIFPEGKKAYAILGLGDIILPILLLVYLLEIDLSSSSLSVRSSLCARAVVAHILALFASFICNIYFQAAQPALFYIVPAMLGITVYSAHSYGKLQSMWSSPTANTRDSYQELPQSTPADTQSKQ